MQSDEELIEVEPLASDVYEAMKGVNCKESERQRIERETQEFLRKKGKVIELAPSTEKADSLLF